MSNIQLSDFLYNTCALCNSSLKIINITDRYSKRKLSYKLYCEICDDTEEINGSFTEGFELYYDANKNLIEIFVAFKGLYSINTSSKFKVIIIRDSCGNVVNRINNTIFEYKHDKNYLLDKIKNILVFS